MSWLAKGAAEHMSRALWDAADDDGSDFGEGTENDGLSIRN